MILKHFAFATRRARSHQLLCTLAHTSNVWGQIPFRIGRRASAAAWLANLFQGPGLGGMRRRENNFEYRSVRMPPPLDFPATHRQATITANRLDSRTIQILNPLLPTPDSISHHRPPRPPSDFRKAAIEPLDRSNIGSNIGSNTWSVFDRWISLTPIIPTLQDLFGSSLAASFGCQLLFTLCMNYLKHQLHRCLRRREEA